MAQILTTNPGLIANLVSRVILAFAGMVVSWVPLRLLVRNGEFAAVVFIIDVAIMNLITIVNSVIWHDDDWSTWWDGAGLCDVEVYLSAPLQTVYAASIFTIMYHLAQQVKVTGAARDRNERTRRILMQAAIIFPVPFVQLVFTWFDLAQRYIIGTLIGCSAVYDASWPKILVYDAPPAVFALLAVPYAIVLWRRYHAITKQAQGVLHSDGEASIRANRTRRRLYNMSLSILVVYVPIMMYFLVCNIKDTLSSYRAYDYYRMHWSATPYSWETILFVPSWIIPSDVMNQPWIPIATTVVIVVFFGMTMEARQIYREYAEYVKLQTWFRKSRGGNDQACSPGDESEKTRESGKRLLPNHSRDSIGYHPGPDTILPSIERPDSARITEVRSHLFSPARTVTKKPPIIPPRYSSLRPNFSFRAPTLQSIRKSIRIPSLRGRAASGVSASGTSNKTTGERTDLSRNDSVPMLPLHNVLRGREVCSQRASGSFLASDDRDYFSRARYERPESRCEFRAPITQRFPSDGYRSEGTAMSRLRGGERASFPREQTLSSLYTSSDTRTSGSHSSSDRDAAAEIGVAK